MGKDTMGSEDKWDAKTADVAAREQEWERKAAKVDAEREERLWQERPELKEPRLGRKRKRGKFHISATIIAKVLAFLLFIVTFFVGIGISGLCINLEEQNFYRNNVENVLSEVLYDDAEELLEQVRSMIIGNNIAGAEALLGQSNADMELWYWSGQLKELNKVLWSTWDGNTGDIVINYYFTFPGFTEPVSLNTYVLQEERLYLMKIYVDPSFAIDDGFRSTAQPILFIYQYRYELLALAVGSLLLSVLCVIFLMCGAGRSNRQEGVKKNFFNRIPLDVLTLIWVAVAGLGYWAVDEIYYYAGIYEDMQARAIYWTSAMTLLAVWVLFYLLDLAVRVKSGRFLKSTLVYAVLRFCWDGLCRVCRVMWKLLCKIPMVWKTVLVYWCIAFVEVVGLYLQMGRSYYYREEMLILLLLWLLEKTVLFFVVLYIAITCKNLKKAGEALADGQESYKLDTSKMFGDFKAHGDNLNSIGQGITKAVEARMKSEHMKTELITNVSHDIKTPLTSIINYADLICEENTDNEKIAEYSEVLLRQSKRLKKLLDDLVDASKATTGNLEVNLQPCEVGVLLTQAAGEYEQKMEEKGLHLIVKQPEEPMKIMADGRHLWRVFDNLLNNICKYAQEGSRVYLNLDKNGDTVVVTFRNMSKYALEISPEELEERFVRGDKSRHMEGNGLGLSIAKSLVELQNGKMEIVIDGDLFKVSLGFQELVEKQTAKESE